MKTKAAVLRELNTPWSIEEIELDPPQQREILIKTTAAGMCHSDAHVVSGSILAPLPIVGGHEGAGEVIEVGEGVTELQVGDHIAASFIPSCGRCRWCASGKQNICDLGMQLLDPGMMPPAGGHRHHDFAGNDLNPMLKLGTFSEYMVLSVDSAVKVAPEIPASVAALVSCGVTTGYGSAINRAEVGPGDTVAIVGCGGLGTAAIQASRIAGAANIVAVDPAELKRKAAIDFGATHTAESMEEATALVSTITHGVMADSVILTPGDMHGDMIAPAQFLARKAGTIVVTAVAPLEQMDVTLNLFEFAMMDKQLRGTVFGSGSPRSEIPQVLGLYQAGMFDIEGMVTNTYTLDDVNQGYADMRDNKNIRGLITF